MPMKRQTRASKKAAAARKAPDFAFIRHIAAAREELGYSIKDVTSIFACSKRSIELIEAGRGGHEYRSMGLLQRYLGWLRDEAESQSEQRRLDFIACFTTKRLCPQEGYLPDNRSVKDVVVLSRNTDLPAVPADSWDPAGAGSEV